MIISSSIFKKSTVVTSLLAVSLFMLVAPTSANNAAPAQRNSLFIITDQEGYGTGECLEKQGGCGKIIADSFCESKGFKVAEYHRKADADEVTGSITSERKPPPREPQAFVISCK
jgi:hypothetical protein